VIVADDYGLGAGHDQVICRLVNAGALNGVSVMVEDLDAHRASQLKAACEEGNDGEGRAVIGLHLNFTETTGARVGAMPITRLLRQSLTGRLDGAVIDRRIETQLTRFTTLFDRPPAFIDGHQHAHSFPGIAERLISRLQQSPIDSHYWVRSPAPGSLKGLGHALRHGGPKVLIIAALGRRLRRQLRQASIPTNAEFAGFLRLNDAAKVGAGLEATLAATAPGTLIMCHPGDPEDIRQSEDHAPAARGIEADILQQHAAVRRAAHPRFA